MNAFAYKAKNNKRKDNMSTITEEKRKHFLTDVAAIRLSLIVLLVVYHAFCIYTGAWDSPFPEDAQISAYKWLGMIIHCFRLETMVFISGYLLGFQSIRKPDALSVHACVARKAKRILLPCLLFGVVYYVMFYDLHAPWYTILLRLLGGCGHLWFLPMIFWCFVFVYLISKVFPPPIGKNGNKWLYVILAVSLALTIVNPFGSLRFGLGSIGWYFLYFLLGFTVKTQMVAFPKSNARNLLLACLIFAATSVAYVLVRDYAAVSFAEKAARYILSGLLHTTNALAAIFVIYNAANAKKAAAYLQDKPLLITLSGYCYGVYIYQQFVLKLLYYHTPLPPVLGRYWLPWVATAITVAASLLLCHYSLKTRLGRFLIG